MQLDGLYNDSLGSSEPRHQRVTNHRLADEEDCTTSYQLFQLAEICFLLAYLMPIGATFDRSYALLMYSLLAVGHLLLVSWIWMCQMDYPLAVGQLRWSVLFLTVNCVQIVVQWYLARKIKLNKEFQPLYEHLFEPIGVDRAKFKKLIRIGNVVDLNDGRAYAREGVTKSNERLSLLISGRINVHSANQFLHSIKQFEFLDSPEWENGRSSNYSNDQIDSESNQPNQNELESTFRVTLIAQEPSRYITWQRERLESHLAGHRQMNSVLSCLLARDITNKLYSMNRPVTTVPVIDGTSPHQSRLDIRLPMLIQSFTQSKYYRQKPSCSGSYNSVHSSGDPPVPLPLRQSHDNLNPHKLFLPHPHSHLLQEKPLLMDLRKSSLQSDYPISIMVPTANNNNSDKQQTVVPVENSKLTNR